MFDSVAPAIVNGAIVDTSIGTAAAGDTIMAELGGESAGIRAFRRRFLVQWDVLAALEAGWLGNEHPYFFLIGPHVLAWLEVGMRLLPARRWSPYFGVGTGGEVSILAHPGLSLAALDSVNAVDGVGGVVAHGSVRASVGVSLLEPDGRPHCRPRTHSLLLYAFGQEAFDAPETNTLGRTFTEIGVGVRFDRARSIMLSVEGLWGVSPDHADWTRDFHDTSTHLGFRGTFRKIFDNGMWIGASALLEGDSDHVVYLRGASYDTTSAPTFRFTLLYGLPLWRRK